jgi:hypothetical protein
MNYYMKQNIIIFSILVIIYYCNYTYLLKSLLLGLLNIFAIVITIFATLSKLYINSLYTVLQPLLSIILPKFWSIVSLISLSCLLREIADILFVIADYLTKISNNLSTLLIQNTIILQLLRNQNTVLNRVEELNRLLVELTIHDQNVV